MNPGRGKHPDGILLTFFQFHMESIIPEQQKEPLGFDKGTEIVLDFSEGLTEISVLMFLCSDTDSEDRREETIPAVQPNSTSLIQVYCSPFVISFMIKFTLKLNGSKEKHWLILCSVFQLAVCVKIYEVFW